MKVPLKWLREYVELPETVIALTDRLTAIGHMQDHPPQEIAGDTVLDLEVRQNRSDCLSILGIAREVGASLEKEVTVPASLSQPLPAAIAGDSLITINDPECYRFNALQFEDITVGASPEWLVQKLTAYGVKSINNLVDITNFVMIEVGEPLHAFDLDKVADEQIIIRRARNGEEVTVLGDRHLTLTDQDIAITDANGILAVGGMIGGAWSSISAKTTRIVLEAATYNQAFVRRSSLRHSLRTEASLRHEKFLHPELTQPALRRAAELIQELCGGRLVKHVDVYPAPVKPISLTMSHARLAALSGIEIPASEAEKILTRLGLDVTAASAESLTVTVPLLRTDLLQEEDIFEEVLRIYGYDKIPDTLPAQTPPKEITSVEYQLEEKLRDILVGFGFTEVITEPLVKEAVSVREPVVLQNSLNSEKTMLRTTLKYSLQSALAYQQKYKKRARALFEVGKIYFKTGEEYRERKQVAGVMGGPGTTYLHVKGMLEAAMTRLGYAFNQDTVVFEKLARDTWYWELDVEDVLALPTHTLGLLMSLPQVLYQDMSVAVSVDVKVGELLIALKSVSPLIKAVTLGESPRRLSDAEKSVFVKIEYHDPDKQLSAADIEPVREALQAVVTNNFNGTLR